MKYTHKNISLQSCTTSWPVYPSICWWKAAHSAELALIWRLMVQAVSRAWFCTIAKILEYNSISGLDPLDSGSYQLLLQWHLSLFSSWRHTVSCLQKRLHGWLKRWAEVRIRRGRIQTINHLSHPPGNCSHLSLSRSRTSVRRLPHVLVLVTSRWNSHENRAEMDY